MLEDILGELEEHHEMFRENLHEINEHLTEEDWAGAQNLLEQYLSDLLDHIAIENDELFIMAENLFTDEEQENMYFLFEDADREMGMDRKEEWVRKIGELNEKN